MAQRTYEGEGVRVHWDSARCIHTARCITGDSEVFNMKRRPWIMLDGIDPERVARAVEACPTGALRYERTDGGAGETPRSPTLVVPTPGGPNVMRGDLRVEDPDGGVIAEEPRLALCRCGATANPPFCDNSHRQAGFVDPGPSAADEPPAAPDDPPAGPTTVVVSADGPLVVSGDLDIQTMFGDPVRRAAKAALCRCGESANKPYCDGSHTAAGFTSKDPSGRPDADAAEAPDHQEPNDQITC